MQEALCQGYILPSTSPGALSFFFVAKKDGGLWPCINYRALNQQTITYPYTLHSSIEMPHGANFFIKLHSAYNLIWIRRGDPSTPSGHYEYRVMLYGLANSPSIFQGFVNEVLWEYLHHFDIIYINNILIYSRNMASTLSRSYRSSVTAVCTSNLKNEIFTGHLFSSCDYIINTHGIKMDQGKVKTVQNWPLSSTIK